jgi:signal transduction histidine kinase
MSAAVLSPAPRGPAPVLNWRRLLFAAGIALLFGLANSVPDTAPAPHVTVAHAVVVGLMVGLAFTLLERYPRQTPSWLSRWVLQIAGVVVAVPAGVILAHYVSMGIDIEQAHAPPQMQGLIVLIVEGLLVAPWLALGALVRQKEALAHEQALALDLARSEMERQALDARLNLLQAQVAPHFLFNTLANVQALVDSGSPQASEVLRSLVAYLRAAVPRLNEPATTLGQELQLVRAYLDLMRMRMPDRLRFELAADDEALALRCPPMTLLTLVENAVRHGIDPSEEGGCIEVEVRRRDDRCRILVRDDGVGLAAEGRGLGTGLAALRERLQLVFGGGAMLRISARQPRGVLAELEFPALEAPA